MIKIAISGSKGKMGSSIMELAGHDKALEISGVFDMGDAAEPIIEVCDCLIEFTTPEATMDHLDLCAKHKKPVVIGTTNLSEAEKGRIKELSREIAIIFSPNMSVGVNLLFKMVKDASKILGAEYSVDIVEAHHVHKKDSPSGTAKEMARIVKEARPDVEVPIESVREDEIVGEHTITFDGPLDTLEITHSAKTRDIFAKGALEAAKFAVTKKHGLFTMKDVLGL
jgi:4-hydroxy-tetrahydrodipicolinate reductase